MKVKIVVLAIVIAVIVAGCTQSNQQSTATTEHGAGAENIKQVVYQIPAGELSDAEKDGILHMREEEKLARDVIPDPLREVGTTNLQQYSEE